MFICLEVLLNISKEMGANLSIIYRFQESLYSRIPNAVDIYKRTSHKSLIPGQSMVLELIM